MTLLNRRQLLAILEADVAKGCGIIALDPGCPPMELTLDDVRNDRPGVPARFTRLEFRLISFDEAATFTKAQFDGALTHASAYTQRLVEKPVETLEQRKERLRVLANHGRRRAW